MHSSFIIPDLNSYPSYFAAYHESWHVGGMFITNSPFLWCTFEKELKKEQQWIYWILVNYTDEPFVFSPTNFFFLLQHAYYLDYKVLLHDSFYSFKILFLNLASNFDSLFFLGFFRCFLSLFSGRMTKASTSIHLWTTSYLGMQLWYGWLERRLL